MFFFLIQLFFKNWSGSTDDLMTSNGDIDMRACDGVALRYLEQTKLETNLGEENRKSQVASQLEEGIDFGEADVDLRDCVRNVEDMELDSGSESIGGSQEVKIRRTREEKTPISSEAKEKMHCTTRY
jgi:hypothetical protein